MVKLIPYAILICFVSFMQRSGVTGERWHIQPFWYQYGYSGIPVHVFAETGICGSHRGQKTFYFILKEKFTEMTSIFVAQFVVELCKEHPAVLDLLAATLFDLDRDGEISHYEKRRFEQYGS